MSTYIAPTAMAAQRGSRCAMSVELDETCPVCGRDIFGCDCGPVADAAVADQVRAAVAEAETKRARAVSDLRIYQGLAKDLQARVRELEARAPVPARNGRADGPSPRQQSGDPLADYLARLVIPEKRAHAEAWVRHVRDAGPVPEAPEAVSWDAADVERKVRRWAKRSR